MNEATAAGYRKLAEHFYKNRLGSEQPTPKRIADALKACAADYRPAYWRRLRNALAFDQREKGYSEAAARIDAVKNPVTKAGDAVKPKQARTKRVVQVDEAKLLDAFISAGDRESYAAVIVARYTGARPAEFQGIEVREGRVFITGAKKSHSGLRGADREIELDPKVLELVGAALPHLQRANIGAVQDRIRAAGKRLWPQRKSVPTLYSWRHQMGSDLKASGMDRKAVAYVMGHQSTESVNRYGNAKMGNGGRSLPRPAAGADLSSVREDHSEPPPAPVEPGQTSDVPGSALALAGALDSKGLVTNAKAISRIVGERAQKRHQDDGLQP